MQRQILRLSRYLTFRGKVSANTFYYNGKCIPLYNKVEDGN